MTRKKKSSGPQVIILCGGQGTRLREETEYKPKPMILIGSKPILWHIMKIYAAFGITDFILALGYKGDLIRDYFLNYEFYNSDFSLHLGNHKEIEFHNKVKPESHWKITLVETGEATMTGGRVKRCEPYIRSDYFFLTYGDGLADVNLDMLKAFHKKHGKLVTLTGVTPPSRWGEMLVKKNHQVTAFVEKAKVESSARQINGGFFVMNREVFDYFSDDKSCILESHVLNRLASDRQLMVYTHKGFWHAMDTYRDYVYLNQLWNRGEIYWSQKFRPKESLKILS